MRTELVGFVEAGLVTAAASMFVVIAGCRGVPPRADSGPRRDAVAAAPDVWAPEGVDAAFVADPDVGVEQVASCYDPSLCSEYHNHPEAMLAAEEMDCAMRGEWRLEPCDRVPDAQFAGACRMDFGPGVYSLHWYASPEFNPDDVQAICDVAMLRFVPAR